MAWLDDETVGVLYALGSALTWALTSLLVRTLAPVLDSVKVNAIRSTLSAALLLGWIVVAGRGAELTAMSGRNLALLLISVVAAFGIGDTVFFESTRLLGLGPAMTIAMTYPLGAALLAGLVLDEPLTASTLGGAVLTLAGLVVIVRGRAAATGGVAVAGRPGDSRRGLGLAAAVVAAAAWAISAVMLKAPLRDVDPVAAQAVRLPLAAATLWATPWAWGAWRDLRAGGRTAVARVALLGVCTALSAVLFVSGLKYAGVAVSSVLSSTAPLFAIPLGMLVLGERLTPGAVLGALLTVAGMAVLRR
jgi:drug/metabolite transporter (DMT)-like permease